MAIRLTRRGEVLVVGKPGAVREAERLRALDRDIFKKRLEGWSVAEVAKYHDLSSSYVHRRIKRIPDTVKVRLAEDHKRLRRLREADFREEIEALHERLALHA